LFSAGVPLVTPVNVNPADGPVIFINVADGRLTSFEEPLTAVKEAYGNCKVFVVILSILNPAVELDILKKLFSARIT
jgi:hypothetical protein